MMICLIRRAQAGAGVGLDYRDPNGPHLKAKERLHYTNRLAIRTGGGSKEEEEETGGVQ